MTKIIEEQIFGLFEGRTLAGHLEVKDNYVYFISPSKSGNVREFKKPISDVERVEIMPTRFGLKLSINFNDLSYRFVGIDEKYRPQLEQLKTLLKTDLVNHQVSVAGHNWGELDINYGLATLSLDDKVIFDIPLNTVSQSITQSKHEVEFLMQVNDNARRDAEELTMIRYYIPATTTDTPADELNERIKSSSRNLQQDVSEQICRFDDLSLQVPRGRYSIALHHDYFTMANKSYSNNIPYTNIKRLMYLNQPNDTKLFILGLEPPVRQGNTSYPFVIIQLDVGRNTPITINATEEELKEKWGGNLTPIIEDSLQNTVPFVVQSITGLRITGADKSFDAPDHYIHASYKGHEGNLYMLKRGFFFLKKPCVIIRYDDIAEVEFSRLDTGIHTAYFDFIVRFNDRTIKPMEFISISNDDFDILVKYVESKGITIANVHTVKQLVGSLTSSVGMSNPMMGDDEPMLPWGGMDLDDDDDDEDDEDFVDEGDDSSSDYSDDDSDGGSGSDDDDDDEGSSRRKKKSKKKSKKEKKEKKSKKDKKDKKKDKKKKKSKRSSDDGDVDGGDEDKSETSDKKRKRAVTDVDGSTTTTTSTDGGDDEPAVSHEQKKSRPTDGDAGADSTEDQQ